MLKYAKWSMLALAALAGVLVGDATAQQGSCPAVTLSARGHVHTQVYNVKTNHMMTFFHERTHVDSGGVYAIFGVKDVCPPQGCPVDPKETQDCTVTSALPMPTFDWGAVHRVAVATTSMNMSIKDPSGTLVLSQNVAGQKGKVLKPVCPQPEPGLPASTPVIHVEIEDVVSGNALGIVSVRIYSKNHPGTTQMDFYTLIGVDPTMPFIPEPASACVTVTDSPGWYDLYWALSSNTVSEQTFLGGSGTILLNQGY